MGQPRCAAYEQGEPEDSASSADEASCTDAGQPSGTLYPFFGLGFRV